MQPDSSQPFDLQYSVLKLTLLQHVQNKNYKEALSCQKELIKICPKDAHIKQFEMILFKDLMEMANGTKNEENEVVNIFKQTTKIEKLAKKKSDEAQEKQVLAKKKSNETKEKVVMKYDPRKMNELLLNKAT